MAKAANRTCTVEGCERTHSGLGYCAMHYSRWRRRGDPLVGRRPAQKKQVKPKKKCSVESCDRDAVALGWCKMHWKRARKSGGDPLPDVPARTWNNPSTWRRGRKPCSVSGCDNLARGLGLCSMHYSRQRRYGTTDLPQRDGRRCSLPDCERIHYSRDLCRMHWERWSKFGDPNFVMYEQTGEFRLDGNGYLSRIRQVDGQRRKEMQHRLIMEELLGRPLLPYEEVHHRNRIRSDNRIDGPLDENFRSGNLELWTIGKGKQPKGARVGDLVEYVTDFHLAAAVKRAVAAGRGDEILATLFESWSPAGELQPSLFE